MAKWKMGFIAGRIWERLQGEMGLSNGVTSGGFERDTNGTQREGGGGIWALNPRS